MTKYEIDFIGFAPEYGTAADIVAADRGEAMDHAHKYIKEFYPELQDVELTEVREV